MHNISIRIWYLHPPRFHLSAKFVLVPSCPAGAKRPECTLFKVSGTISRCFSRAPMNNQRPLEALVSAKGRAGRRMCLLGCVEVLVQPESSSVFSSSRSVMDSPRR